MPRILAARARGRPRGGCARAGAEEEARAAARSGRGPAARDQRLPRPPRGGHAGAVSRRLRPPEVRVPAGGAEYLATHVRDAQAPQPHTLVVAAGDLVGGSPLLSSLFHDEPTIEAMNAIGLDISAVGNHEFDEGAAELLRLQRGGCHPIDGCADGTAYRGAEFPFLAANVEQRSTGRTIFPPYVIRKRRRRADRLHRDDARGHAGAASRRSSRPSCGSATRRRPPTATSGELQAPRRAGDRRAAARGRRPRSRRGVGRRLPGLSRAARGHRAPHAREVDVFLTGHTHAAYNCVIDGRRVTSAGSLRPADHARRRSRSAGARNDVVRARADNWVVGQDVMRAPDITALIAHYARFAAPLRERVIGRLARCAGRTRDRLGREPDGQPGRPTRSGCATGADGRVREPRRRRAPGCRRATITYGRAFSVAAVRLLAGDDDADRRADPRAAQAAVVRAPQRRAGAAAVVGVSATRGAPQAAAAIPGSRARRRAEPGVRPARSRGAPVEPRAALPRSRSTRRWPRARPASTSSRTGTDRVGGPDDTDALEAYLAPSLTGDADRAAGARPHHASCA